MDTPAARELALDAAHQAIVLLSNSPAESAGVGSPASPILPLKLAQSVAVIGPHANCTQDFLSNYHGTNTVVDTNSPLAALERAQAKMSYAPGLQSIEDNDTDTALFRQAVTAASKSDVAIVFAGLHQLQESENHDRTDLLLPGAQHSLIRAVVAANPRTCLVLINGGPLAIQWEKENVPAILETFCKSQSCITQTNASAQLSCLRSCLHVQIWGRWAGRRSSMYSWALITRPAECP